MVGKDTAKQGSLSNRSQTLAYDIHSVQVGKDLETVCTF